MPNFNLYTNVSPDKVTPDVLKEFSETLSKTLDTPEHVSYLQNSAENYNVGLFKISCFL